MKVGERRTFDAGTAAGCWGAEGDAVAFTTPTVGRAKAEVRAVRQGTATVHFTPRESGIPRRNFPVAVEARDAADGQGGRPGMRCQMHGDFEGVFCPECHPEEAADEARRFAEESERLAAEEKRLAAEESERLAAAQVGEHVAEVEALPSPSEDARTLAGSLPGPEDDDEVSAAARRLRERQAEGDETPLESEASN